MGEYGSEVSYFIAEPTNFAEDTKISDDINQPCLKATKRKIKNLIKNQTFIIQEPKKGEPVTPCMDVTNIKFSLMGV